MVELDQFLLVKLYHLVELYQMLSSSRLQNILALVMLYHMVELDHFFVVKLYHMVQLYQMHSSSRSQNILALHF